MSKYPRLGLLGYIIQSVVLSKPIYHFIHEHIQVYVFFSQTLIQQVYIEFCLYAQCPDTHWTEGDQIPFISIFMDEKMHYWKISDCSQYWRQLFYLEFPVTHLRGKVSVASLFQVNLKRE
jgi:hypothetical protein